MIAHLVVLLVLSNPPSRDKFDRADPHLGPSWSNPHFFALKTAQITPVGAAKRNLSSHWLRDTFTANQFSQVTVSTIAKGAHEAWIGVACRANPEDTAYYGYYVSGTTRELLKQVDGVTTTLGQIGELREYVNVTLRLECEGSTLRAFIDGHADIGVGSPYVDRQAPIVSGNPGLLAWRYDAPTTATQMSNWSAGELPPRAAWYNGQSGGSNYKIGRALVSPSGAVRRDSSNPKLSPSPGEWDGKWVAHPSVLQVGGTLYMYYAGCCQGERGAKIGLATSVDGGQTWNKQRAVLNHGVRWTFDEWGLQFPRVLYDASETDSRQRWKMWYVGQSDGGYVGQIGYAFAADGVHWTKYNTTAVLRLGEPGQFDDGYIDSPVIIKEDQVYRLFYGGCKARGGDCQIASTTFLNPNAVYDNAKTPALRSKTTALQPLTKNLLLFDTLVTVSDGSSFVAGEPVMVVDDDSPPQLNRVTAIAGSQIVLRDHARANFTTDKGATLRSVFWSAIDPASVWWDGERYRMMVTGFRIIPNYLLEHFGVAWAPALVGPWSFDASLDHDLAPDWATSGWDIDSSENFVMERSP